MAIEPHVLLQNIKRPAFRKFATINEEQASWPLDNPRFYESVGTASRNDRNHHVYYSSLLESPAVRNLIQNMEPNRGDTGGFLGPGKVFDLAPISVFQMVQHEADFDYVKQPKFLPTGEPSFNKL